MKVFNCILGILTVLASIYCIFYPGLTFLNVGWIVTIILGLWGISSIVSYAVEREVELFTWEKLDLVETIQKELLA